MMINGLDRYRNTLAGSVVFAELDPVTVAYRGQRRERN